MISKKVIIASVLKPTDDPRAFEKMALSIAKTNKYEVKIIGFPAKKISPHRNVTFISLSTYSRLSPGRWLAPWKILRIFIKEKPELVIINTPDLLIVTHIFKILFGARIIYDIREDYKLTFLHRRKLNLLVRYFIAYGLRSKEKFYFSLYDQILLAERCYLKSITSLPTKKTTILENKAALSGSKAAFNPSQPVKFVISGTLNTYYGTLEAIRFAINISKQFNVQLRVVGCARETAYRKQIMALSSSYRWISLEIAENPQPHAAILQAIKASDIGLMLYKIDPAVEKKIPSKFYEHFALNRPFITTDNPYWEPLKAEFEQIYTYSFAHYESDSAAELLRSIQSRTFTPSGNAALWSSEEDRLLKVIERLFPDS